MRDTSFPYYNITVKKGWRLYSCKFWVEQQFGSSEFIVLEIMGDKEV